MFLKPKTKEIFGLVTTSVTIFSLYSYFIYSVTRPVYGFTVILPKGVNTENIKKDTLEPGTTIIG